MRILFMTFPAAKSHLYHMTPVAWALRAAGHQVRVAISPDLADDVDNSGLTGVTIGEPMFEALTEVDEESEPEKEERRVFPPGVLPVQEDYASDDPYGELEYLTSNFLDFIVPDSMLDDLVQVCRDWQPDLVVWDQLCFAGAVAAKVSGAAHARFVWGADALIQLRDTVTAQGQSDPLREWTSKKLRRYDQDFSEDVITGQWTVDATPSWTYEPRGGGQRLRVRHLPYNGPGGVPEWLHAPPSRKRICITLGVTMGNSDLAEASAEDVLDAVSDLDVEVIATLSESQLRSATTPDNVRVVDFVPMNALLPTCSAVVHHGGSGTFSAALEHGVPQLIVPPAYWSSMWYGPVSFGAAVAEQGAGTLVAADSDHLTVEALRADLVRVLEDPSYQQNAERLRVESLGTSTPHDIVPAVEKLTAQYRTSR